MRPVRYNAQGQRRSVPAAPFARQKLTSGADDATRVRQLEQQVRELEQRTEAARSAQAPKVVEMRMEVGKNYSVIRHGFGHRANWRVVDWKPVTAGDVPTLMRLDHDDEANTLRVFCSVSGTYTIEVS